MEEKGLNVLVNSTVSGFTADKDGNVEKAVINGKEVFADLVVIAVGVKPNTAFLKGSGIELGKTGAVKS